ncbi:MAG: hypothetical protein AB2989_06490 [Candidatus Symbiodolus clandestinus]
MLPPLNDQSLQRERRTTQTATGSSHYGITTERYNRRGTLYTTARLSRLFS